MFIACCKIEFAKIMQNMTPRREISDVFEFGYSFLRIFRMVMRSNFSTFAWLSRLRTQFRSSRVKDIVTVGSEHLDSKLF